jgi:hypothetical protein
MTREYYIARPDPHRNDNNDPNVQNVLNDLNLPREMQLLFQRGVPNVLNVPNELTQFSSLTPMPLL